MLITILKTVLVVFNIIFILGASKDFTKENHGSFAYIVFLLIELIIIVVLL